MRKEEYIREVISQIQNKKARADVEKELSAHIDDRISYYVDAGWDEQTANEKAMEHMGEAESVAEKLGLIHNAWKRYCFIVLIALLVSHIIIETLVFFLKGRVYYLGSGQYYEDYIFFYDIFCFVPALIFAIISYRKNGTFLMGAIAFEVYALITGMVDDGVSLSSLFYHMIWNIEYGYEPLDLAQGGFLLRCLFCIVLIVLTLIACRRKEDKDEKESNFVKVYSVIAYSLVAILITVFIEILYQICYYFIFNPVIFNPV